MVLAAIDIGSNAARLLLVNVEKVKSGEVEFQKLNLVRVALRLGLDVFTQGIISPEREQMFENTMKAFQSLMQAYKVSAYRACATSAMRDAKNGLQIIQKIKAVANIQVEIISGEEEANLVFENHYADHLEENRGYLYIDVGGGSTELSFYYKGKHYFRQSFNIGTIRLMKNQVTEAHWEEMKKTIQKNISAIDIEKIAIGSGGNINKVFSLSKQKDGKPLSFSLIKKMYTEFSQYNVEELMEKYNFKRDRADVIVPALQIYVNVMKWTKIQTIYVPKIGLSDGLIHQVYDQQVAKLH